MYLKDKFCEKDNSIIDKDIPHICHVITTKKNIAISLSLTVLILLNLIYNKCKIVN